MLPDILPENSYAVIIGINNHKPKLHNLEKHAISLVQWLSHCGLPKNNIWLLLTPAPDAKYDKVENLCHTDTATNEHIKKIFETTLPNLRNNNKSKLLIIYFLGHGGVVDEYHDSLFCAEEGYVLPLSRVQSYFYSLMQKNGFHQFIVFADMCRDQVLNEKINKFTSVIPEPKIPPDVNLNFQLIMAVPEYQRACFIVGVNFSLFLLKVVKRHTTWPPDMRKIREELDIEYRRYEPNIPRPMLFVYGFDDYNNIELSKERDPKKLKNRLYEPKKKIIKFFFGNDMFFFAGYDNCKNNPPCNIVEDDHCKNNPPCDTIIDCGSCNGQYLGKISKSRRIVHRGSFDGNHLLLIVEEGGKQQLIKKNLPDYSDYEKMLYQTNENMILSAPLIYEEKVYFIESCLEKNSSANLIIQDPTTGRKTIIPFQKQFLGICTDTPIMLNSGQICLRWLTGKYKHITLSHIQELKRNFIKILHKDDDEKTSWSKLATDGELIYFVKFEEKGLSRLYKLGTGYQFPSPGHELRKHLASNVAKAVINAPLIIKDKLYVVSWNEQLEIFNLEDLTPDGSFSLAGKVNVDMIHADTHIIILTEQTCKIHPV